MDAGTASPVAQPPGQGQITQLRIPGHLPAAQLIVSLVVVLVATAGVLAVGRLGFGVPLPRQPAGFVLVAVLSATAMLALGLLIGAVAPTARSAGAAGTVLFFPLMYFAGLRVPDYGRIRVAGLDPRQDRRELRQLLGVQLQESELPDRLTVAEAMRLYASFYPRPADVDGLLAQLDLADKSNTRYRRLSGGQKQRLSIALALIGRPRIAILDELTTGLDPVARRDAWQLIDDIRNQGVTIVLVTHFMDEAARLCDRVAIMRDGRIAALGAPAALAQPTLEDAFLALTGRGTS